MEHKEVKCPKCNSDNVVAFGEKIDVEGQSSATIYRCYDCNAIFEFSQEEAVGDNFPLMKKEEPKIFRNGDKVKIKIDTGIYYYGKIIRANNLENLYKVKYKNGHTYQEEIFKGELLELDEEGESKMENTKDISKQKEEHKIYDDMGSIPRKTTNNLTDLWIDLWEFLKEKKKKVNKKPKKGK